MKTKTVLIKCELPEDVNLPLKEIYFSDGRKWLKTTNAKIIDLPSDEEIHQAGVTMGEIAYSYSWFVEGATWFKSILQ